MSELAAGVPTNGVFEEPWWLDAVAPGEWGAATASRDGLPVARLVYRHRRRTGLSLVTAPPLTQTTGPWLRPSPPDKKYAGSLADEHRVLGDLVDALPGADLIDLNLVPSARNVLPFAWKGFTSNVRYTYRLDDLRDLDAVWAGITDATRNVVRKAEKVVSVRDDGTAAELSGVLAKSFERQGLSTPHSPGLVERVVAAATLREAGRVFVATDGDERVHAAVLLVWDGSCAYYLLGGGDPALRESGAQSLLVWHAIKFAAGVSAAFDFEGSSTPGIEHFFRNFGARQTPLFNVRKVSRRLALLTAGHDAWQAIRGKPVRWLY